MAAHKPPMHALKLELYRSVGGDIILFSHDEQADKSTVYQWTGKLVMKSVYGEGARVYENHTPVSLDDELKTLFLNAEHRYNTAAE